MDLRSIAPRSFPCTAAGLFGVAFAFAISISIWISSSFAVARDGNFSPRDATALEAFGPFRVGVRRAVLVDSSRVDERLGGPRTLVTEIWYPAADVPPDATPARFSEFFAPHEKAAERFVEHFDAKLADVERRFECRAVRDAPLAKGRFPLIIFSHGNGGVRHQNVFQVEHLASHGYIVASPDHTGNAGLTPLPDRPVFYDRGGRSQAARDRPLDVSFVIDSLLAAQSDASSWLRGALDSERIGVAGHSFGGFTACRVADSDPRVRAILPMTVAWGKGTDIPVLVFVGGRDETIGALGNGASRLYWESCRGPKYLITIERAGHFSFTDMDAINPDFGDGVSDDDGPEATFLPVRDVKRVVRAYGLAFFDAYLRQSEDALAFLRSARSTPEVAFLDGATETPLAEVSSDKSRLPSEPAGLSSSSFDASAAGGPATRGAVAEDEPDGAEDPVRILIVTGADVPAHDWRATTPVTRELLEEGGGADVRVCEDLAILETDALHSYDVVVLNFRDPPGAGPSDRARENLARFVRSGKGLVALHFAVYAFSDWKEYPEIIGRVWVGRRSGEKVSGHGPRGKFEVHVSDPDHPAAGGLADFEADDELYAKLQGEAPIETFLTADSDWSGRTEPIAWTRTYGEGRVFVSVLGHDAASRRIPAVRRLFRQGTLWAAGRLPAAAPAAAPTPARR